MNLLIIIFLIFLGIVLLLIEFVIVPGVTIAGIGGFLMLAASVYLAFTTQGNLVGFITLAFVLFISPYLIYKMFKTRLGRKMMLESEITGVSNAIVAESVKVGDEGITVSRLAPIGKVKVNGGTVEAKSTGIFIDQHTKVKVIEVLKTQIIVEPIN